MNRHPRRRFLTAVGGAAALGTGLSANEASPAPACGTELGMLYDATRCVGCKACMVACKRVNGDFGALAYEKAPFDPDAVWDTPEDLSGNTRTIIKLHRSGNRWSYVKFSCMHCCKPSCVSACPVSAMTKDPRTGIVSYNKDRCIGCRYCQVACAFNVPRFQWDRSLPQIVKCDLCQNTNLQHKGIPACAEVCPAGAITFGPRSALLEEAHARLAAAPDRYLPQVYGQKEVGGTHHLYLAGMPFATLGLPDLPDDPPATISENIQHTIYKGFVAPVALYATLCLLAVRNLRKSRRPQPHRTPHPPSGARPSPSPPPDP